ncbi:MAG: hypothetical protein ABJO52_15205, partial [Nisaea sp.]
MKTVLVKFIRSMTPYMAGETAGFPPAKAKIICDKGYAVLVESAAAEAKKSDQKTPGENDPATDEGAEGGGAGSGDGEGKGGEADQSSENDPATNEGAEGDDAGSGDGEDK